MKRTFDATVSFLGLVLLSPFLLTVAVFIKLDSRGPVLFRQQRIGKEFRPFLICKFRTMLQEPFGSGRLITIGDDPRITRAGRWLRKTKIDELPQLINVLLGDMSLVGPRPLPMRDVLGLNVAWQKRRFSVKPGLTCLWQVSGRSNLSFEEWMQLDLEYIDRWSLALDCKILLRTIPAILTAEGAA